MNNHNNHLNNLYLKQKGMPVSEGWLWVFRAGIGFILLAGLLFLIGFSTDHWHDDDTVHYGLWETCLGGMCSTREDNEDFHIATQAFQVMAVIAFVVSPIVHFFLYCGKKDAEEGGCKTRIFDIGYSIGLLCHLISVLVFGLEIPTSENLSWSYQMSSAGLAIGAIGIFLVIISRKKAMHRFVFFSSSQKSKRKGRVGNLNSSRSTESSSRAGTPADMSTTRRSNNVFGPQIRHHHSGSQYPPPMQPQAQYSTASSGVPYPYPYGQYPQGATASHASYSPMNPVNPQPYTTDPAYPPPQHFDHQPSSSGLAPLRIPSSAQPSAPPMEHPPSYGDVIATHSQSGASYDPSQVR